MRTVPEDARICARLEGESIAAAQAGSLRCCAGGGAGCCATGDAVPAWVASGLREQESASVMESRATQRESSTREV
jgi:hypothetical protein